MEIQQSLNRKEHFAVMDDSAVRVELEPDKPVAFVNFGDYGLATAVTS